MQRAADVAGPATWEPGADRRRSAPASRPTAIAGLCPLHSPKPFLMSAPSVALLPTHADKYHAAVPPYLLGELLSLTFVRTTIRLL